jgi:amidase
VHRCPGITSGANRARESQGQCPLFHDHVPTTDATFVRRMRQVGAITVGKTNTPEFGAGSQTFNNVFGDAQSTRHNEDVRRKQWRCRDARTPLSIDKHPTCFAEPLDVNVRGARIRWWLGRIHRRQSSGWSADRWAPSRRFERSLIGLCARAGDKYGERAPLLAM